MKTDTSSCSRVCTSCQEEKPLDSEHWHRDASRLLGFMYTCKKCEKARAKTKKPRPNLYRNHYTEEQKERKKSWSRDYYRTPKGRAAYLSSAYKKFDRAKGQVSDIDTEFMETVIFTSSCSYCGITGFEVLGCDRIDNNLGHTRDNVVPCCGDCNLVRGDRYSHEEMKVIGKAIKQVIEGREKKWKAS